MLEKAIAELNYLGMHLPERFQQAFYERALGLACQTAGVDAGYAQILGEGERVIPRTTLDEVASVQWPSPVHWTKEGQHHLSLPVGTDEVYSVLHFAQPSSFGKEQERALDRFARCAQRYEKARQVKMALRKHVVQALGEETVREIDGYLMERDVEDIYRQRLPEAFAEHDGQVRVMTNVILPEELLGEGAQGAVYKGKELSLTGVERVVAYKLWTASEHSPIFRREMRRVIEAVHRNIVDVFMTSVDFVYDAELGVQPLQDILVMEYIEGHTLTRMIEESKERGQRFTQTWIDDTVRQLVRGLQRAHNLGMVHRDIKPSNVLFSRDGTVKIMDFGSAVGRDEQTQLIEGTPAYMAPEQARGEQPTDKTDIWALGSLWYYLATGEHILGRLAEGKPREVARRVAKLDQDYIEQRIHRAAIDEPTKFLLRGCLSVFPGTAKEPREIRERDNRSLDPQRGRFTAGQLLEHMDALNARRADHQTERYFAQESEIRSSQEETTVNDPSEGDFAATKISDPI